MSEEVENEIRAVAKLCQPGANRNIVFAFKWGRLIGSPYFFIDMELCDFNLETYISQRWVDRLEDRFKLPQILRIMRDITNGITFIHETKEIHRDLKPRNGNHVKDSIFVYFSSSLLLQQ